MHYWWGKCLSLSKNYTRSTFSLFLTLSLRLLLVIFSLVPGVQSMHPASWGELMKVVQKTEHVCGTPGICVESYSRNKVYRMQDTWARNVIQRHQLKAKYRAWNSTMSHKFMKYLKYILWLTGCWQRFKSFFLPFDRATGENTIKLLSEFIQLHWECCMRRCNTLSYMC